MIIGAEKLIAENSSLSLFLSFATANVPRSRSKTEMRYCLPFSAASKQHRQKSRSRDNARRVPVWNQRGRPCLHVLILRAINSPPREVRNFAKRVNHKTFIRLACCDAGEDEVLLHGKIQHAVRSCFPILRTKEEREREEESDLFLLLSLSSSLFLLYPPTIIY